MKATAKAIFGTLLLSLATAAGPIPTPSVDEVNAALANVHNVVCHFTQDRHVSLFTEPLHSEGLLCFEQPGRVRWETTSPYKSILISDGTGVAQFEWTDNAWKKLNAGLGDALQHIVAQIAAIIEGKYASGANGYSASVTNAPDGVVVTLVPGNASMRKMIASVEVRLTPDLKATKRVILREVDGDYTDIQFSEQSVNLSLPPRAFDRSSPVDISAIIQSAKGPKS
jgi:outer membrane lipoprotein-sorting protein